MRYLSEGLFHQNKFPVKSLWLLFVAACVLSFNRCVCPCPLPRHLHYINFLYAEAVVRKCFYICVGVSI